jgi:predicted ABC-type exoprotein transport system permease subunit
MKKLLPDVLLVAGAFSVSYGAWLAWHPAGFIVIGSLAIVAAIKLVSN